MEPPVEIQQAVEIAKKEAEYILRTPRVLHKIQQSGKPITNPFLLHTPTGGGQSPRASSTSSLPKPLMIGTNIESNTQNQYGSERTSQQADHSAPSQDSKNNVGPPVGNNG